MKTAIEEGIEYTRVELPLYRGDSTFLNLMFNVAHIREYVLFRDDIGEVGFSAGRDEGEEEFLHTLSKGQAIAAAKAIIRHYEIPFCNRVTNDDIFPDS